MCVCAHICIGLLSTSIQMFVFTNLGDVDTTPDPITTSMQMSVLASLGVVITRQGPYTLTSKDYVRCTTHTEQIPCVGSNFS